MTEFSRTYNSFSGVDMHVTFGPKLVGELQGISFTVQREKAPMYTMGSPDPRSFSRGKRGIAGSLIFMVFDRSALLDVFKDKPFLADKHAKHGGPFTKMTDIPQIQLTGIGGEVVASNSPRYINLDKILARPLYHDQVLPFEIVVTAANEYGSYATMGIHGVEILNCGSGMSIDDITTDEACTFVARGITSWQNQGQAVELQTPFDNIGTN
jgi:hypothetical protein